MDEGEGEYMNGMPIDLYLRLKYIVVHIRIRKYRRADLPGYVEGQDEFVNVMIFGRECATEEDLLVMLPTK